MNEKEAVEILRYFEPHKVIPFTWLQRDLDGNPTALACAEAVGFFAGLESERKRSGKLLRVLEMYENVSHLDPFNHERDLRAWEVFRLKALAFYQGTAGDEEGK